MYASSFKYVESGGKRFLLEISTHSLDSISLLFLKKAHF